MKKLMTAFAACALAGAVFAQVESQNIVGYQTQTINAEGSLIINNGKLTMLGLNWQAVGGSAYPIQSLFGGDARAAGLTADASSSQADQLQVGTGQTMQRIIWLPVKIMRRRITFGFKQARLTPQPTPWRREPASGWSRARPKLMKS